MAPPKQKPRQQDGASLRPREGQLASANNFSLSFDCVLAMAGGHSHTRNPSNACEALANCGKHEIGL
jgi:hypothetical protein